MNIRKSTVIMLACVAASTAGVAAIVAISRWQAGNIAHRGVKSRLRDVQEVLADCYSKINAIERNLPANSGAAGDRSTGAVHAASASVNGRPAYDAS